MPVFFLSLLNHTEHITDTRSYSSRLFWSSRDVSGFSKFESLFCLWFLAFSFCLNRQHLLCFMAQSSEDTCSSEDPDSLLFHLVNKTTLEGSNHFPPSFFPLKYKIKSPGIAFLCRYHTTTSSPDL